jgi:hypothetical protein
MFKFFRKKRVLSEEDIYRRSSKIGGLPVEFFGYEELYKICQKLANLIHKYDINCSNEKIKIEYERRKIGVGYMSEKTGPDTIELAFFQYIFIDDDINGLEKVNLNILNEADINNLLTNLNDMFYRLNLVAENIKKSQDKLLLNLDSPVFEAG